MTQRTRAKDEVWPLPYLRAQGSELDLKLKAALSAYDAIVEKQVADTTSLMPIVRAALDPHVTVYESAAELLAHLTVNHQSARDAVSKMSTQRDWHIRFNALSSLGATTPKDFSTDIVRTLLFDKSARVREKAADQALRLGLEGLVGVLRELAMTEPNAAVVDALELSSGMLKDGYVVKGTNDGFWVTVWTESGAVGSWYSQSDFERRGLSEILSTLHRTSPAGPTTG